MSTYLPLAGTIAEKNPANQKTPIFMAHGTQAPVIPLQRARLSREVLEANGYPVQWHEYAMPHSVCSQEVGDISAFISRLL